MIQISQNNDVYEIRSKYDPTFIEIIKSIPGRRWLPDPKVWTIPLDKLGFLLNAVVGTDYEDALQINSQEYLGVNQTFDKTKTIPDVDISKVKFYVEDGKELYQHQKDTMKYALYRDQTGRHSGFLLGDQPGLGKTLSVMNLALHRKLTRKDKHCLVICCINTAKYNWYEDIIKHTNGEQIPYLIGTRKNRKGVESIRGSKEKLDDLLTLKKYGQKKNGEKLPYFLIINIEAIRYKEGRKYPIADRIIELINEGKINMIAVDEIHKNCSPTSNQGKQVLKIKKQTGKKLEWIPMTGTPITKSPLDCFLPFRLIDAHDYSSFYLWSQNFCVYGGFGGHEVIGYKNMPQLKSMVQDNMLRRLKKDVLDLPPKIHITEYVENTPYQQRLYAQVRGDMLAQKGVLQASMNPLAQFIRLRQVNGYPEVIDKNLSPTSKDYLSKNAKMKRILEIIDLHVSQGEKVVVYSNWVEPLRTLYRYVSKKYKTCCYTGTMSDADKEKNKRVFTTNPEYMVMLGTIGALGTSHTLTVAHVEIFFDEPWNATDKEQAEDRCHRISATEPLMIYTMLTTGTVDDRVHNIVYTKDGIAKYIVDDDLDFKKHPELFDLLLSE
ncbi:MAG: DEAD/DEAH box helicase [Firmicutes bacterium]|nr:DEAD/DEAH box helicase [Bacillota bacterium]